MQVEARRATASQARQTTLNIALGIEHAIERMVTSYDLSLRSTMRALALPGLDQLDPDVRDAALFDGALDVADLGRIIVYDARGQQVYASGGPIQERLDVTDRDYFTAHRGNGSPPLLIGGPIRSRLTGQPAIPLSRRVNNPDGSFAGVVAGSIHLRYFEKLVDSVRLGPGGVFTLRTLSGELVTRLSEPVHQPSAPPAEATPPNAEANADGIERFTATLKVGTYPLELSVGIAADVVYAEWTRQTVVIGLLLALVTLIGAVGCATLRAELVRRRRSEAEARQTAAQLAMLTDHATDIILHVGWDGVRHFASSACERIVGYTAAQIAGSRWLGFVHPEDQPLLAAALETIRVGGEVGLLAYRVRGADGAWRHVESNCRALPNDAGVIFVIRDVSERTRLEERLRQSHRREAIGQLTAGVAHDFNNMLQAQLSTLEHLGDAVGEGTQAAQLVRQAISMAQRGASMTQQLLSFSRQQPLRPAPASVAELLPELARLLQQMFGPAIQVVAAVQAHVPPVLVDASYLEAALLNLALNARDAMPAGGTLRLEAVPLEATGSEVPADLDAAERYVVITVTDDGAGMDDATLQRACEPFFTTKGVNGSGLGLASVQGFTRQSGGDLRITSAVGVGTRIEMFLPVAAARAVPGGASARPREAGSARVLLVDDDPLVLAAVACGLSQAGFEIAQAVDAEAAIALMAATPPFDALVTDFTLPGRDGVELVEQARQDFPAIATVVITGWAGTERLRYLPAETMVVRKPFRRDELTGIINRAIATSAGTANPQHALAGPDARP